MSALFSSILTEQLGRDASTVFMVVTTFLLILGAIIAAVVVKWWFSVSGQLYRNKSIPVPSGALFINFKHVGHAINGFC